MPNAAYAEGLAYVRRWCVPEADLTQAAGLGPAELATLRARGVAPEPTYCVGQTWIASAIGHCGAPDGEPLERYFGPSVAPWLRRAALLDRRGVSDLRGALVDGLARDMAEVLDGLARDARAYGWAQLFTDGTPNHDAVRAEIESYWPGWMRGGWAVCLRRFDGRHLVAKEVERRRIAALTRDWTAATLTPDESLSVLDAMHRLDAVILPFSPFERPAGTPGQFLDRTVAQYGLPWTTPDVCGPGRGARATSEAAPANPHA
jgi:hypothetical protein